MGFIRLVHSKHFDKTRGRFHNTAFKKDSRNGGISVIQRECIDDSGRTICEHIRQFYESSVGGDRPIFWEFTEEILPAGYRIEQTHQQRDDKCHHDIFDISNNQQRRIAKALSIREMRICIDGDHRQLVLADLRT